MSSSIIGTSVISSTTNKTVIYFKLYEYVLKLISKTCNLVLALRNVHGIISLFLYEKHVQRMGPWSLESH